MIAIIAKENIGYYQISLKKGSIKMQIQLLLAIQPQHLVNILNGDKTLELRKLLPKNFDELVEKYGGIWVNLYCAKAKPYLYKYEELWFVSDKILKSDYLDIDFRHNGKVVARFWFDEWTMYHFNGEYRLMTQNKYPFLVNATIPLDSLCLSLDEVNAYGKGKNLYAWHIKNLEIFDTPKELSDFYYYKKQWVHCGMDCPPYVDEVKYTLRKAPQSFRYVYVKGEE